MKFGLLAEEARKQGIAFDYFATGHYARIEKREGRFVLKKGADPRKDQSYFLYRLTQKQLATTMFPLGEYTKDQVREMARARGLVVAEKTDSQDFYAGDYADLLEQKPREGRIVLTNGKVLGKHQGFWNYTIGQRKGLGIAYPEPLFVVDIDAEHNQVVVGTAKDTFSEECLAKQVVWGGVTASLTEPVSAQVKYRSSGKTVAATLYPVQDGIRIVFDEPQRAITRGQSIVFYQGDDVLGGGIIQ
jgi:tRNA-specific 2-thiouridylase